MATLFDDTYHGARWRYGLLHRPISGYVIGRGDGPLPHPILFSHRPSADPRFPHGEAEWPCELAPEAAEHHGLVLIGQTDDGSSDEHPNLTAQLLRAED